MAYINFEEEKEVAKDQLYKRRNNNKKLFSNILDSKNISNSYKPNERYSYKEHNELVFGGGHPKKEEDFEEMADLDILCATFNKCIFSNIKFLRCKFIACTFNDCDFIGGGALFEDCSVIKKESEINSNLNKVFSNDSNLSGFKLVDTYIQDLEFKDKDKSKFDENTFFDKIQLRKKDRDEYEGVYTVYENIADKFKDNNLKNNFGEYYFLLQWL